MHSISPIPFFLSFLQRGCLLRFLCAVHFTDSNRVPQTPATLPYSESCSLAQYGQAFTAVGQLIQPYLRHDRQTEGYAFDAVLPASCAGRTSFHFSLNLSQPEGEDARILCFEALLESDRKCVRKVKFGGPTNLCPVLKGRWLSTEHLSLMTYHFVSQVWDFSGGSDSPLTTPTPESDKKGTLFCRIRDILAVAQDTLYHGAFCQSNEKAVGSKTGTRRCWLPVLVGNPNLIFAFTLNT